MGIMSKIILFKVFWKHTWLLGHLADVRVIHSTLYVPRLSNTCVMNKQNISLLISPRIMHFPFLFSMTVPLLNIH